MAKVTFEETAAIMAEVTADIEVTLNKTSSIAANEFAISWGYKDSLTSLYRILKRIHAMLRCANRQKGSEVVIVFLKQLKTVVIEADDVLGEVQYEVLRCRVKKQNQTGIIKIRCIPNLKTFWFHRKLGHKIENIDTKLSNFRRVAMEIGAFKLGGLQNVPQGPVRKGLREEFKIVGREKAEQHIAELFNGIKRRRKANHRSCCGG